MGEREDLGGRILEYLTRQTGTSGSLENGLGVSAQELEEPLADLDRKGWIRTSQAWYGDAPDSAVMVISLTPAGREEAERRRILSDEEGEPHIITREELASELKRRFGWTDEQIALDPHLGGETFYYWPSIGAWTHYTLEDG